MARERIKRKSMTVLHLHSDTLHIIKSSSQLVGIKQQRDHYFVCLIKKGF